MRLKRIISSILAAALSLTILPSIPAKAETGSKIYTYDGYQVEYTVQNEWTNNQTVQVTLTNTDDESILNWALKYNAKGEINGLWNASVYKEENTDYIIKNAGYNYEIQPNQSVNFGYTLTGTGESFAAPDNFEMCTKRVDKTDGYNVSFNITQEWDTGFDGTITVNNTSSAAIEGWKLSFNSNFTIVDLWNGRIVGSNGTSYTVANQQWTSPIQPNSSVTIGLTATKTAGTAAIAQNFNLSEVVIDDTPVVVINPETNAIKATAVYDSENKVIKIGWTPTNQNGIFDVLVSNDGINFTSVGSVADKYSYVYTPDETIKTVYIKVKQTIENVTSESNVVSVTCSTEVINWEDQTDTDNDGLPDVYETYQFNTDPNKADTDGDGLPDGYELNTLNTDPTLTDTNENGISDADEDFDDDKLNNLKEYELGTDPLNSDSDYDGLSDYDEVSTYGTNPLKSDTDGDSISDGDEITLGLNPNGTSTNGVPDNEYTTQQTVSADDDALAQINCTANSSFKVSLDIKAAGVVSNNLSSYESGYSNVMKNDAILGVIPEFDYTDNLAVDDVVINFDLDSSCTANVVGTYAAENAEFQGIKRFNIFKYFEDENILLPVETFHDVENNRVYTHVDELGTYCLVDMEIWLKSLNINPDASTEVSTNSSSLETSNTSFDVLSNINAITDTSKPIKYDVVDIAIVIQTSGHSCAKRVFDFDKKCILDFSRMLYSYLPNARIKIFTVKNDGLNSPYDNDDYAYKESDWLYSYNSVYGVISQMDYNIIDTTYAGHVFTKIINLDYRGDAVKQIITANYNCLSHTIESDDDWNRYNAFSRWNIMPNNDCDFYETNPLDMRIIIENTYIYNENIVPEMFENIYSRVKDEKVQIISSAGLTELPTDFGTISKTSTQDYDKDGLSDADEIDFNNSLITANEDNDVILPTLEQYINSINKEYVKNISNILIKKGVYDTLKQYNVLPTNSDPLEADGDNDRLNDNVDPRPYSRVNNGDVMPVFSLNGVTEYTNDLDLYDEYCLKQKSKPPFLTKTFDQYIGDKKYNGYSYSEIISDTTVLQQCLEYLGYLNMDKNAYGTFGGRTKAAVQTFQLNYGFQPLTGNAGDYQVDYNTFLTIINVALNNNYDICAGEYDSNELQYYYLCNQYLNDNIKKLNNKKYFNNIKSIAPKLTVKEELAGVTTVSLEGEFDKVYYLDLTKPINIMFEENAKECHEYCYICKINDNGCYTCHRRDETLPVEYRKIITSDIYLWFYNQVKSDSYWDIKRQKSWNGEFNNSVRYFNSSFKFIFNGEILSSEQLGNYMLGSTGKACGFSDDELTNIASLYSYISGDGWDNPDDRENINKGIAYYKKNEFKLLSIFHEELAHSL